MKIEDMHKDVHKALLEDEKYQQFMESIKDDREKKELSDFMERFMGYFQEKMFNPLVDKIEKDPEFKDAVYKNLEKLLPNKDKER